MRKATSSPTACGLFHRSLGGDFRRWQQVGSHHGQFPAAERSGGDQGQDSAGRSETRYPGFHPRSYPGDTVVATGFPFGIGPSVRPAWWPASSVRLRIPPTRQAQNDQPDPVRRGGESGQFRRPAGQSRRRGGGIVTAIYNPTGQHVFAGMAFAVPIENAASAVGENPL